MIDRNEKELEHNSDGMAIYDYIVNHTPECIDEMDTLTEKLIAEDRSGKYVASAIKFLVSIDNQDYRKWIYSLLEAAIQKDRERRYIGGLLEVVWGPDYNEHVEELNRTDDNFRRIYKRVYPGNKV